MIVWILACFDWLHLVVVQVPRESFVGPGSLPNTTAGHVWFKHDFTLGATDALAHVQVFDFSSAGALIHLPPSKSGPGGVVHQVNVVPAWRVQGDCVAVLGEVGKVVAASSYRFASLLIGPGGGDGLVSVVLRGAPDEKVSLLFAINKGCAKGWSTSLVEADIGSDGVGNAKFTGDDKTGV